MSDTDLRAPEGHAHAHAPGPAPRASRRVRLLLAAALLPILLATILGAVTLWPRGDSVVGTIPVTGSGSQFVRAEVVGVPVDGITDGVAGVTARLDDGGDLVEVQVPPEHLAAGLGPGDRIKVMYIAEAAGYGSPYIFMDHVRTAPIGLLAICYAVLVVAVARWRGLAALVGLGLALAGIAAFTLPALLAGSNALAVGLVTASGVMFVVLYVAHGFSARTTTALLGTVVGLAVTGGIGYWASGAAHLTGLSDESALMLPSYAPDVDLRGVVLCGLILAGLGVLNDVTITQSSAVWELRAANPGASRRELFGRAMRIGRDHIASTVYTIAFAYVGAALPLLLLVAMLENSFVDTLTSGEIAEEVVRTLVGSIGLVLAIPITTAVAVLVVSADDAPARA
ncbi:YibE/F family protein [Pengzhenrongella frigida]|uniref:YibE/F family protein n=1 Tax=Pengzhenrongella frigida TaxID=1259133 RepID=A0A4Q5N407_9MICO|nr:YibE/F family protein [Cellulomonas sp. HLT2-17]RYV52940.1 YibE/F family protein [Cellulomonas sp. HLT2-17]